MTPASFKAPLQALLKSAWLFPLIATLVLLGLTCLRISGSSVGEYDQFFYGQNYKDSHLIAGVPQAIRSDEWLFNTQMTVAQANSGFPRVNKNIGTGRDMSLVVDVPYKDWSILFKPQNLAFFVLPLEFAFAFKWWLLLYLLLLGCYFFVLRLLPGKRLLAALLACCFGFSPFIFWWYQTITIAPLFYGFFMLLLGMRIINGEPLRPFKGKVLSARLSYGIYSLLLAYVVVSFALVLYPPFQVPVALGVVFYLAGYLAQTLLADRAAMQLVAKRCLAFVIAIAVAGVIGAAFIKTRSNVIASIEHTVYPGARVVSAGGFDVTHILDTYLQPQLQRYLRSLHFYTNQSEASNFILLFPFLLLPGIALTVYDYKKHRKFDWPFIAVQLCLLFFLANLFVAHGQFIYKLTLLTMVPHERLAIGLGFVGFIQLLYIIKKMTAVKVPKKWLLPAAGIYGVLCLLVELKAGHHIHGLYPLFVSWPLIIAGAGTLAVIVALLFARYTMLAVSLLLVFTVGSIIKTDPLYQGLGPLRANKVLTAIQNTPPSSHWAAVDDQLLENFAIVANRDSLSGVQFYPDLNFWRQVAGKADDDIYNRYAHINFTSGSATAPIFLMAPDHFGIQLACTPFITHNVSYVLLDHPLDLSCAHHTTTINYPARSFYIYKIQ